MHFPVVLGEMTEAFERSGYLYSVVIQWEDAEAINNSGIAWINFLLLLVVVGDTFFSVRAGSVYFVNEETSGLFFFLIHLSRFSNKILKCRVLEVKRAFERLQL